MFQPGSKAVSQAKPGPESWAQAKPTIWLEGLMGLAPSL